jgi:Fe-S-cluster containining protein
LSDDDAAQEAYFEAHGPAPCPALDPASGACDLYAHRPLSCRTYGLPVRIGPEDLPPCPLCFTAASAARVESCRVTPDPDDAARVTLREVEERDGAGDTVVAFALARA